MLPLRLAPQFGRFGVCKLLSIETAGLVAETAGAIFDDGVVLTPEPFSVEEALALAVEGNWRYVSPRGVSGGSEDASQRRDEE